MADMKVGDRITVAAVVESEGHDDRHIIVRVGGTPVQVPVAGAIALHAAAETRWAALREEIKRYRDAHSKRASDLADEGKDAGTASTLAGELTWVLATMDRMEAEQ